MSTEKQVAANRENGKKGGVKTAGGKSIVKWNALAHGLLAREVVIDAGDGQESREEFDSLLADLREQLQPAGVLEEILVEKIATSYWRYRRVVRHEVGLIRSELDRYQQDYYDPEEHKFDGNWKTHHEVQAEIDQFREDIETFKDADDKEGEYVNPQKVEEYGWDIDLNSYYKDLANSSDQIAWQESFRGEDGFRIDVIHAWLLKNGWTPQKIKGEFIRIAETRIKTKQDELGKVKAEDEKRLSQIAKVRGLALGDSSEKLIRYEGSILRQFYRAMHELERLQKSRQGVAVPLPIAVDVEMSQADD